MTRPELAEFLSAFRASSEAYWHDTPALGVEAFRARGVGGTTWVQGTRWKPGLTPDEIAGIELTEGLVFPADYAAVLRILNAPDRPALKFGYVGAEIAERGAAEVFTDWTGSPGVGGRVRRDVLDAIGFDVEQNRFWAEGWGARPATPEGRAARLYELHDAAPHLVRLHGHRFLVAGLELSPAPVLSVFGSDAILFADSIEACLALDFPELAGGALAPAPSPEARREVFVRLREVPFWGALF